MKLSVLCIPAAAGFFVRTCTYLNMLIKLERVLVSDSNFEPGFPFEDKFEDTELQCPKI